MLRKLATVAAFAMGFLLSGCAGNGSADRGGVYLAVALETGIGTLISLEQTGVLPTEGVEFIEATLTYGGGACKILADPTLDGAEKRAVLITALVDERMAFNSAFEGLAGAGLDRATLLVVMPAINGARAAVRIALTEEVDPARYERPCATVSALLQSWDVQHPI